MTLDHLNSWSEGGPLINITDNSELVFWLSLLRGRSVLFVWLLFMPHAHVCPGFYAVPIIVKHEMTDNSLLIHRTDTVSAAAHFGLKSSIWGLTCNLWICSISLVPLASVFLWYRHTSTQKITKATESAARQLFHQLVVTSGLEMIWKML